MMLFLSKSRLYPVPRNKTELQYMVKYKTYSLSYSTAKGMEFLPQTQIF